jgi:predicted nucleic acid-binding protein
MGTGHLVDTNIAIYTLKGMLSAQAVAFLAKIFNSEGCTMSVVTHVELLGFAFPDREDEAKAEKFVFESLVLPLSDAVADQAIAIRKMHKIKLGDAFIAATAMVSDLTLVTRNEEDFKDINDESN